MARALLWITGLWLFGFWTAIQTPRPIRPGGFAPPDPPSPSLAGAPFAPLRSGGSLAALVRASGAVPRRTPHLHPSAHKTRAGGPNSPSFAGAPAPRSAGAVRYAVAQRVKDSRFRPHNRLIDLGHPINAGDPSWDGSRMYQRTPVATIEKDGYAAGKIEIEEHFGTHLDAPSHFAASGWTVDRIPVDRLYGPAVRIDVSKQAAANPDYRVTVDDVRAFERLSGVIPRGAIALIATGWDRFWPDRAKYMNEKGGIKHFPGLTAEAVGYLARDRQVAGIVIDTPSIDYGPSTAFEAHHVSMPLNVFHVENAARLTALPASGFHVIVAPLNIGGGSGGPTRVFALLN